MIAEKELQELRALTRCKNGQGTTLQSVLAELQKRASGAGVAVQYTYDQVKSGLFGGAGECLVLYNPEHRKDYVSIVVRLKEQGGQTYIAIDSYGTSKLLKAEETRKALNSAVKESVWNRSSKPDYNPFYSAAAGAAIVGAGVAGVRHLIKGKSDKENREIELQWYADICDMLIQAVS